jgi:hypothetical protein
MYDREVFYGAAFATLMVLAILRRLVRMKENDPKGKKGEPHEGRRSKAGRHS